MVHVRDACPIEVNTVLSFFEIPINRKVTVRQVFMIKTMGHNSANNNLRVTVYVSHTVSH